MIAMVAAAWDDEIAAGASAVDAAARPLEDLTMAGYVRAHLERHGDHSYDILPVVCPAADEHTYGQTRCLTCHGDGWARKCMYLITPCENDNATDRIDASMLAHRADTLNARQVRCGVICQRQRGNRPPGC